MKKSITNQESGFTLIELLVTVAIIGIIAATAVPHYNEVRKKAYKADRMAAQKMLVTSYKGRAENQALAELTGRNWRRIVKRYSGNFNGAQGGGTKENLMSGVPAEPNHFQFTTRVRNPKTANANDIIEQYIIDDCRDGIRRIWSLRNRGSISVSEIYRSATDSAC